MMDQPQLQEGRVKNPRSIYFKVMHFFLKITGLWIAPSKRQHNFKVIIFYLVFLSIGCVGASVKFYYTATDLLYGTEVLLQAALMFHTMITYSVLMYNQKRIMKMINLIETNFDHFNEVFGKTNHYLSVEQTYSGIITIIVACVILTVHVSYMYVTQFYFFHLDYTEKQLLYPISLPIELNNNTYYVIYFFELVTFFMDFNTHVTSICLCTGFINQLCGELYLLGETVKEISCADYLQGKVVNESFESTFLTQGVEYQRYEHFKICIEHHKILIQFYKDIQNTFGISVLDLTINCELMLCLASFQTLRMFQLTYYEQFSKSMCMLMALIVHCYVYFWYGEKLNDKSKFLRIHICQGEWYKCPHAFKTSFKILLERTKRPIVIKAAKIAPVTLGSFIKCLQAAFSYFNLLLALNKS